MLYINQEDGEKKVVFCKDAREVSLDNLVSAASRPGRFVRAGPSFNHPEHVRGAFAFGVGPKSTHAIF